MNIYSNMTLDCRTLVIVFVKKKYGKNSLKRRISRQTFGAVFLYKDPELIRSSWALASCSDIRFPCRMMHQHVHVVSFLVFALFHLFFTTPFSLDDFFIFPPIIQLGRWVGTEKGSCSYYFNSMCILIHYNWLWKLPEHLEIQWLRVTYEKIFGTGVSGQLSAAVNFQLQQPEDSRTHS